MTVGSEKLVVVATYHRSILSRVLLYKSDSGSVLSGLHVPTLVDCLREECIDISRTTPIRMKEL